MNQIGKGLASLGICGAVAVAAYSTGNGTCLWALLIVLLLW